MYIQMYIWVHDINNCVIGKKYENNRYANAKEKNENRSNKDRPNLRNFLSVRLLFMSNIQRNLDRQFPL